MFIKFVYQVTLYQIMKENLITGSDNEILDHLINADVYPDIET